ncbi:ABC transporter ATP-binding protein [Lentilactobacillus fungorum]|uniref:ABC transporter ATP-binding protein n=1 Tax=Lentilactobacillus fungorum TaxID=2201250 RepID=A0ABQ3W092_9LACO|nr:ATP-binding cassette domain-containing protein [Lentilactobacillus fungorum]GHP13564.1 ABC transporter ATP-binding protein [Lentilactobacillus fungorum]
MKLTFNNLSMTYGKNQILNGLTTECHSGELIGLLGPNGAGKTTLIKLLATLASPTGGDVLLDGTSIVAHPNVMRKQLGYLPQQVPYLPNLTAREYLTYIAAIKHVPKTQTKPQIENLLSQMHLQATGNKRIKDFSGGMRQRVGIAATLLNDPQIIIADEPTAGLDPEERVSLRNIFAELANDHLVIIATHIVSDIEAIATNLLLIQAGQFRYDGTPADLLKRSTGTVWEYRVDDNHLPANLNKGARSLIQRADGIHVREIAAHTPSQLAKPVAADLEEACLGVFKGVIQL